MRSWYLQLLLLAWQVVDAQNPVFTLACANYPQVCNNKCFGVYVAGAPTTLTKNNTGVTPRRNAAGCNRRSSPCCGASPRMKYSSPPTIPSCDEYPYASTDEGGTGAVLRCVNASQNAAEGGSLSGFYASASGCNRNPNCVYDIAFSGYTSSGSPFCTRSTTTNDGYEYQLVNGQYTTNVPREIQGPTEPKFELFKPDPKHFIAPEERREWLLSNGERIMMQAEGPESAHIGRPVFSEELDPLPVIVRELIGNEKSEPLRPGNKPDPVVSLAPKPTPVPFAKFGLNRRQLGDSLPSSCSYVNTEYPGDPRGTTVKCSSSTTPPPAPAPATSTTNPPQPCATDCTGEYCEFYSYGYGYGYTNDYGYITSTPSPTSSTTSTPSASTTPAGGTPPGGTPPGGTPPGGTPPGGTPTGGTPPSTAPGPASSPAPGTPGSPGGGAAGTCPPTGSPQAGPLGAGTWGLSFWENGCSGTVQYGDYNNTPGACANLVTAKPWDSVQLTKTAGLQIQFYSTENCSPCGACSVYNNAQNKTCVTDIVSGYPAEWFVRSIAIVENGTAPGNCVVAG